MAAMTLQHTMSKAKPGTTLEELDVAAHEFMVSNGAYPSGRGLMDYPRSVCTTVNDCVTHGIPNSYELQNGDYVNIDVVCYYEGHHGDTSAMVPVGTDVHIDILRLIRVTREAQFKGIEMCRPGLRFNEIGPVIEDYAAKYGYYINEQFEGHGIAHDIHLPPVVHGHRSPYASKAEMKPGMAFTIEPIVMLREPSEYKLWSDGWTIQAPGVPSACWEHVVLIKEEEPGYEILTLREGELRP